MRKEDTMEKFRIFQKSAKSIIEQIEALSVMLENDDDLREYLNIYMNRFFTEEDEPIIMATDFVYEELFSHRL